MLEQEDQIMAKKAEDLTSYLLKKQNKFDATIQYTYIRTFNSIDELLDFEEKLPMALAKPFAQPAAPSVAQQKNEPPPKPGEPNTQTSFNRARS